MSLDDFSAPVQTKPPVNPLDDFSAPQSTAPAKTAVGALGNPDEAGKALALSKQTGIAPAVVQTDLPGYEQHARTQQGKKAIQNPALEKYVQDNPMAATVSADDWDNLSNVSMAVSGLHQDVVHGKSLLSTLGRIATEFSKGAEEAGVGMTPTGVSEDFLKGMQKLGIFHDPAKGYQGLQFFNEALITPVASGINTLMRGASAAITGTAGGFGQTVEEVTGSQGEGQRAKREVENFAGFLMSRSPIRPFVHPSAPPPRPLTVEEFLGRVQAQTDREAINEFMNRNPQAGPMLMIEKARTGQEALDNAIEVAQTSKTKERSPEAFAQAVAAHDPGTVHIDGKAIAELYAKEGKAPVEGDGLLGFVPDLAGKVQAAAATGGEVSIPVADYIAHVDPTVHEGLKDNVRLHEDGVTATEAKEAKDTLDTEEEPKAPFKPKSETPEAAATETKVNATQEALGTRPDVFLNLLIKDGKALGITERELSQYSDKIARMEQHVLDKSVETARRFVSRSLTPEWKRQEAAVRETVAAELAERGPFAAEKFLRENKITLGGDNVDANADALAPIFGFDNGMELRQALTDLETTQAADRKNVRQQLKDAVEAETARRMEASHGSLAENIAKEARQIALADHTFDVLADEVRFLAKAAGVEPPLSRTELVAWAKQSFERSPITDAANYTKLSRAVAKSGREAEKALLKGDYLEAFQAKQRQMLAATVAKESLALQSLVNRTEAKIDRFTSEQFIKSMDQEHLEQIRGILDRVGVPQQYPPTMDPLPLADFTALSEGQIQAAPWLEKPPKLTEMTVEQFRDFADSIDSIAHVGRQVTKVRNAHAEADLLNVIGDIVKELERFPFINQPANAKFTNRAASAWRRVVGMHLLVERVFDYTDQFNPHGPITEWLDRPLRDANTREIQLTEEVTKALRDLKPHVDKSIHDKIPNTLIRDANDKTGFMNMNRMNLRVLMLNMGNWSNMRKLVEGFGVNEADLRRFVDANASAADVAWVNGIHGVFKRLKPEADAVQLRDTGVPVDHIEAVSWEVAGGKLEGGYYPLSYDLYNSDIQARIATPLFDKGYFSASTPKGYTQERTGYAGAIDLSGNFLQSKIQGMVHDIAFREAVRNANKLIENQEFRTAVSQYWGKEVADLLPTWLRDIANSHNFDETYARDLVYTASQIRQNIVNTLIGMNPGTVMKHGLTAAIMSADRVGLMPILQAVKEIGLSGLWQNMKGLVKRQDFTPDPAFMDEFRNALVNNTTTDKSREFVMQASAVMRNRQRQWEDSIRGALDAVTRAGPGKTYADLRQLNAQWGRMAVAWGDQATAMPTWLAAYKKAYMAGESHADAVFIADKEVSRAHGSNFTGDQPSVTRLGNTGTAEFMKWFTSLYRFWNHNQNNLFQLAWDASAAAGGRAEPGANSWSISRRVGYVMAIIAVEELAAPAKDEDGRGILAHMAMAGIRYFGGGWVGLREITNSVAHGYEPSTGGLTTTFIKSIYDNFKDLKKAGPAKDWIKHTVTNIGFTLGVGNAQLGKTGQFIAKVATGRERPQTFNDWRQGLRTGSANARKHK